MHSHGKNPQNIDWKRLDADIGDGTASRSFKSGGKLCRLSQRPGLSTSSEGLSTHMEYGLRRYEAMQRLLWFLFFLFSMAIAYPMARSYQSALPALPVPAGSFQTEFLKSKAFWTQLHWIKSDSILSFLIIFLIYTAIVFLAGRLVWLLIQYVGKFFVKRMLVANIPQGHGRPRPTLEGFSGSLERLFPAELLLKKASRFPLPILFHPFQRLRLMLIKPGGAISSEEMLEMERRIVETDWQVLWGSWTPFRWLLWVLPLLAILQTSWMFYVALQPALEGHMDLNELFGPVLHSFLPLAQIIGVAIILNLAAGLFKRIENLYLSGVDALLYDQFLSRLPFQSSDTLIILEAMQKHFMELQNIMRRMERSVGPEKD